MALAEARSTFGLNVEAFDRWLAYRDERKPSLKTASLVAAAKELAAQGDHQAAVVQQSIANGWQGLFPLKQQPNGRHNGNGAKPKTRADQLMAHLDSLGAEDVDGF